MNKYTLAVTVDNRPGVLTRIASLFRRRGYNIDSLSVGTTHDSSVSRMTIVVDGDRNVVEQLTKQLYKLVEVIKVVEVDAAESVQRELALIKIKAEPGDRADIAQMVNVFRARVVDISKNTLIVEVTGNARKIDAIQEALAPFGILEMVRTGRVAIQRGGK
ncbi:MAG: acetolactate synthase small subunit [Syntrophomonadaceae bacterium]|nr:acetolactate synthase small subunit [Syntrophomonadaceae bacterium]